jgi:hypothetical protein
LLNKRDSNPSPASPFHRASTSRLNVLRSAVHHTPYSIDCFEPVSLELITLRVCLSKIVILSFDVTINENIFN